MTRTLHQQKTNKYSEEIKPDRCKLTLKALSICQEWPAGPVSLKKDCNNLKD